MTSANEARFITLWQQGRTDRLSKGKETSWVGRLMLAGVFILAQVL